MPNRSIQGTYIWFTEGAENQQVTKDFTAGEYKPRGKSASSFDKRIWAVALDGAKKNQIMRDAAGIALHINSAYRPPAYNDKIGGTTYSWHQMGSAFDIRIPKGYTVWKLAGLGWAAGYRGMGIYDTFVHFQTPPSVNGVFFDKRDNTTRLGYNFLRKKVLAAAEDWEDKMPAAAIEEPRASTVIVRSGSRTITEAETEDERASITTDDKKAPIWPWLIGAAGIIGLLFSTQDD